MNSRSIDPQRLATALPIFKDSNISLSDKHAALQVLLQSAKNVWPQDRSWSGRIKATVKYLPGVRHYLHHRYEQQFAHATYCNLFRGVFASHAEAAQSAPKTKNLGYDHDEPAAMYQDHLDEVYPMDFPAVLWLGYLAQQGTQSVFDFGGHIGVAFYAFSKWLDFPSTTRWTVFDMPAVTKTGEAVAQTRQERRIAFTNTPYPQAKFDVFYAAGSLQYSPLALAQILAAKPEFKPRFILINKTPTTDSPTCVTLQNIGTAFCTYTLFNEKELVQSIEAQGYRLLGRWTTPDLKCTVPYFKAYANVRYAGFLFELHN